MTSKDITLCFCLRVFSITCLASSKLLLCKKKERIVRWWIYYPIANHFSRCNPRKLDGPSKLFKIPNVVRKIHWYIIILYHVWLQYCIYLIVQSCIKFSKLFCTQDHTVKVLWKCKWNRAEWDILRFFVDKNLWKIRRVQWLFFLKKMWKNQGIVFCVILFLNSAQSRGVESRQVISRRKHALGNKILAKVDKFADWRVEKNVFRCELRLRSQKCYRLKVMALEKLIYYCQQCYQMLINWWRGVQSLVKSQQISAWYLNN